MFYVRDNDPGVCPTSGRSGTPSYFHCDPEFQRHDDRRQSRSALACMRARDVNAVAGRGCSIQDNFSSQAQRRRHRRTVYVDPILIGVYIHSLCVYEGLNPWNRFDVVVHDPR